MTLSKLIRFDSFLRKITFLGFIFISVSCFSQNKVDNGELKFKFICDHSQTTIIADQSVMVYIMSLDCELLVKQISYCSRKKVSIPVGTYSVIIESPKYCTHIIDNYTVSNEQQIIEINLLKETDPECVNEQSFEPHPTRFN
tara:strand:+ start:1463 stop:1888 length:426 start_codon:yes stop_codon:yes gene_type:complete